MITILILIINAYGYLEKNIFCLFMYYCIVSALVFRGRRGRDLIVVGFTTTNAISAYHH